jgi:hypothetical protein
MRSVGRIWRSSIGTGGSTPDIHTRWDIRVMRKMSMTGIGFEMRSIDIL